MYVCVVVKEMFRLCPVAPLLIPYRADTSSFCHLRTLGAPQGAPCARNPWHHLHYQGGDLQFSTIHSAQCFFPMSITPSIRLSSTIDRHVPFTTTKMKFQMQRSRFWITLAQLTQMVGASTCIYPTGSAIYGRRKDGDSYWCFPIQYIHKS